MAQDVTPIPLRAMVNKARKRKYANNKTKNPPGRYWCKDADTIRDAKIFASLEPGTFTTPKADGSFYRLYWSTPEERKAERIKAGV